MKKQLNQKLDDLLKSIASEQHPAANKLRSKLGSALAILEEWPKEKPAEEKPAPPK